MRNPAFMLFKVSSLLKLSLAYCLVIFISCSPAYPEGYLERFQEFEEKWSYCYDKRFHFPTDPFIKEVEYVKCNIDGKDVLINNHSTGYEGRVFYSFSWSTATPGTSFTGNEGAESRLMITFMAIEYFRQIVLYVKYPPDSLNYTIQKTFSQPVLECATNFGEDSIRFEISTSCTPNGEVGFSSRYSTRELQAIHIDRFYYEFRDGEWHYHLEYSFDEMELTNGSWNSSTKTDVYGKEKVSDVLIENILVKDYKCVIEFELPPG